MICSKNIQISALIIAVISLSGCYLEQGKLHFAELNLDPIVVYEMAAPETTIYCLAEGNIPSGDRLALMHKQSMAFVEKNPEKANWGELVCLALAEDATLSQMKETINVLQLVIAVRPKHQGPPRAYKKIVEQRIRFRQTIENQKAEMHELRHVHEQEIIAYKEIISNQINKTSVEKEKVKELEQQVQKLKEIELLLQPKP